VTAFEVEPFFWQVTSESGSLTSRISVSAFFRTETRYETPFLQEQLKKQVLPQPAVSQQEQNNNVHFKDVT